MHNRIIHITFLALAFILAFSASPSIALDVPSQYEQDLLQLINDARENPLIVASSLGMDADKILQNLPELEDILINGLPPLIFNENLCAAAGAHTQDMLENNYYSHISLDGRTCDDRIVESGYVPTATGESLGMLAFSNFIQPAEAVALIFENMFRDELDPTSTERRNILAGDLEEVGIGFGSGTFKIDGSICNAYMTTCDFAKSVSITRVSIGEMEQQLLELIKQLRARPLEVIHSLGINLDPPIESQPLLYTFLTTPVFPLVPSASLQAASRGHSKDMLANNFVSHFSSDGKSVHDRMAAVGYTPLWSGEVIQLVEFPDVTLAADAVYDILRNMIQSEILIYMESGSLNLLNPDLQDLGVSIEAGTFELDAETTDVLITTVTLGAAGEWKPVYIVGTVYVDENKDGLNSLGEGVDRARITLESVNEDLGSTGLKETFTNSAGGFMCPVDFGVYRLTIHVSGNEPAEYLATTEEENVLLEHRLE